MVYIYIYEYNRKSLVEICTRRIYIYIQDSVRYSVARVLAKRWTFLTETAMWRIHRRQQHAVDSLSHYLLHKRIELYYLYNYLVDVMQF